MKRVEVEDEYVAWCERRRKGRVRGAIIIIVLALMAFAALVCLT